MVWVAWRGMVRGCLVLSEAGFRLRHGAENLTMDGAAVIPSHGESVGRLKAHGGPRRNVSGADMLQGDTAGFPANHGDFFRQDDGRAGKIDGGNGGPVFCDGGK